MKGVDDSLREVCMCFVVAGSFVKLTIFSVYVHYKEDFSKPLTTELRCVVTGTVAQGTLTGDIMWPDSTHSNQKNV